MLYHIYNMHGERVSHVDATNTDDALQFAKKQWPGAQVDKWLTKQEELRKQEQQASK